MGKLYLLATIITLLFIAGCASQKPRETQNDVKVEQSQKYLCQSCSMPMIKLEDFGTNNDESKNNEYCCYCFQNGKFINPEITMEQMIDLCVKIMVSKMNMPEAQAKEMMKNSIPQLKRWQKPLENK